MDIGPLIGRAVEQKTDMMTKNAEKGSDGIIGEDGAAELFGRLRCRYG